MPRHGDEPRTDHGGGTSAVGRDAGQRRGQPTGRLRHVIEVSDGSSALAGLEAQAAELTKQVNRYDQEIQAGRPQSLPMLPRRPGTGHPASGLADNGPGGRDAAASKREQRDRVGEAQHCCHEWWNSGHSARIVCNWTFTAHPVPPDSHRGVLGLLIGCAIVIVRQRDQTSRPETRSPPSPAFLSCSP